MLPNDRWARYQKYLYMNESLGLALDYSCFAFSEEYLSEMNGFLEKALGQMEALERGALANPDEGRMVGHYWLRDASLAPQREITVEIKKTQEKIKAFAQAVQNGKIVSATKQLFRHFLLIGIGGSALGPQFMADVLKGTGLQAHFLDNTDPDGFARVWANLQDHLGETLVIVISKSGGTVETRNGMRETQHFFATQGIPFAPQAIAVTTPGSKLDQQVREEGWLARFALWDWVGGRTSLTSAVGLLPAALQGIDVDPFLRGARFCDQITRQTKLTENPAALLALMWYYAVQKKGKRNMVLLPYRDRLQLFPRYLQQLVMESLGKEKDLHNNLVEVGLTVYGNKGSTDQHAYVQQLLEGAPDSFVVFLEVQKDERDNAFFVAPDVTSGDYLKAFLEGTRRALGQKGRESLTLSLQELTPFTVGALVALFERTVGLYAFLLNLNAYHQPGVELGKKSAGQYIILQQKILTCLRAQPGQFWTAEEIATQIGSPTEVEFVYKILEHLYLNEYHPVKKEKGTTPFTAKYFL